MISKIDQYNLDGYVVIRNWLNPNYRQAILDSIYEVFQTQVSRHSISNKTLAESLFTLFKCYPQVVKNCGKAIQNLPLVHKLGVDDRLLYLLTDYGLKNPCIATKPVIFFHNQKLSDKKLEKATEMHQDAGSICGSLNGMIVLLALTDYSLEIVEKSHLKGIQWTECKDSFAKVDNKEKTTIIELEPGDMLLFNQFLVHGSTSRTSNDIKFALNYRYNDLNDESWINRGYPNPYIYKPQPANEDYPHSLEVEMYFRELIDD